HSNIFNSALTFCQTRSTPETPNPKKSWSWRPTPRFSWSSSRGSPKTNLINQNMELRGNYPPIPPLHTYPFTKEKK
uniref:Uncharacterized protein n=1 Tax=Oryza brachyantha TaxID=4533 RepID=J3LC46_ORYBR